MLLNHGLRRDMVETQTNQRVELIMKTEFCFKNKQSHERSAIRVIVFSHYRITRESPETRRGAGAH